MKIKYNLKSTFIFIYLLQVKIKKELEGSLGEGKDLLSNQNLALKFLIPPDLHLPKKSHPSVSFASKLKSRNFC